MKIEKEYKKSTLMNWKKEDLVEHILCLIHNNNVLHETLDVQAQNYINATRWIPVSERLPDKNATYHLVTTARSHRVEMAWHLNGDWFWNNSDSKMGGVIAWMPLPEPFKSED